MYSDRFNSRYKRFIELIMVFTLLAVLAASSYALISAGSGTGIAIGENKRSQINAKTAMGYINAVLRKNDVEGAVSIRKMPGADRDALVIYNSGSRGVAGSDAGTDTWFYFIDGYLAEYTVEAGEIEPPLNSGEKITEIADLRFAYDEEFNCITSTVFYKYAGETKAITSTIHFRSKLRLTQ